MDKKQIVLLLVERIARASKLQEYFESKQKWVAAKHSQEKIELLKYLLLDCSLSDRNDYEGKLYQLECVTKDPAGRTCKYFICPKEVEKFLTCIEKELISWSIWEDCYDFIQLTSIDISSEEIMKKKENKC